MSTKLVKSIGEAKPWMFQRQKPKKKIDENFVRMVYCSKCVAMHEENKHITV